MSNTDTDQQITSQVIRLLDRGIVPWASPGLVNPRVCHPSRAFEDDVFTGISLLILATVADDRGYTSHLWESERDLDSEYYRFPKKGGVTVLWRDWPYGSDEPHAGTVHNLDRCRSKYPSHYPSPDICWPLFDPDAMVTAYCNHEGIRLNRKADEMSYDARTDTLHLPPCHRFMTRNGFFCSVFRLLAFSVSHPKRMPELGLKFAAGWDTRFDLTRLAVEMACGLIGRDTGISPYALLVNRSNGAARWRDVLSKDERLVLMASRIAHTVARYVLLSHVPGNHYHVQEETESSLNNRAEHFDSRDAAPF